MKSKNHMKMGAGIFWGAFLLLLGVALIIKVVFQIDFPVFKVLVGIFLVLLGIKVLFGRFIIPARHFDPEETIFNERTYNNPDPDKEYTVLFGKGVYDFTDVDLSKGSFHTKISTVFGGTQIIIPRDVPVRITADAVFAGAELPDGNTAAFGSTVYESDSWRPDSASINIKVDVVFGGVQVISR
ncbi:MAG: cell wall-active antibiotics response protein [Bacteroidetes bacterium]|nr:cell wall-active antibiotics response protein [Bacteroidota bacterium]